MCALLKSILFFFALMRYFFRITTSLVMQSDAQLVAGTTSPPLLLLEVFGGLPCVVTGIEAVLRCKDDAIDIAGGAFRQQLCV